MFSSIFSGFFGGIGILVASGLLILLVAFLFGSTIGNIMLVLIGLAGIFALYCWFGKRVEKRGRQDQDYYPTD